MSAQLLHDGRFELLSSLGEGGFGTVYEAFDRSQQARVALKALTRINPDALFRFKREFRAMQDLAHPNLVTLGELFESSGQWFFTMELVQGCDFLSFVRPTEGAFHEARLRASLLQLAEGLSALHAGGTIHRDVKPPNMRITPQGRLVLLDFGLITHGDEARQSTAGGVVGTVAYMAPEQAAGGRLGPAADWYSVGMVLYEALTGTLPFEGSPIQILMAKQGAPPSPPSTRARGIPADLDRLCSELLQTDPSTRPSGPEILARLRGPEGLTPSSVRSQVTAGGSTFAPPFLGRQRELAVLSDAAASIRSGEASALYVHGISGIGKSAVVRHFTEDLEARDPKALVLNGRCFERETVPYKAFDGVVDELSRFLRRLTREECAGILPRHVEALTKVFPVLSRVEQVARASRELRASVDRRTQRDEAFGALRELFARLADRVNLVVVIDDLQWADADSLLLLDALLAPPDPPLMLLIATGRNLDECPEPIRRCVASLLRMSSRSRSLEVRELGRAEARDLAARLLTRYGGNSADADRLVQESSAQPLLIDELARFVSVTSSDGQRPDLDQMLRVRIEQLDPITGRVLELVALAGIAVPQEVITTAAQLDPEKQIQVISSLRLARLIKTGHHGGRSTLEIFHDRVRLCIASAMSAAQRADSHRVIARAMEALPDADPAALALFWMEAGEADRAAEFALRAGDRAGDAFAFERAASLYRRVLDAGATGESRRKLFVKLGDALACAGRCPDAADAFLSALDGAPEEEQLELRRRACQQLLQSGHLDRGLTVADELLSRVGLSMPKTPGAALRSLIWQRVRLALRGMNFKERERTEIPPEDLSRIDVLWSVSTSLGVVDHIRSAELETRLLRHSLDSGEPKRVGRALALESCLIHSADPKAGPAAKACIGQARALAQRLDDSHGTGLSLLADGMSSVAKGELRHALGACDAAATVFRERCVDVTWERDNSASFGLLALYFLGDHDELARRTPLLLRDADERGDLYARANCMLIAGYYVSLTEGRLDAARAGVKSVMSGWSASGFYLQHFLGMLASALLGLYEGTAQSQIEGYQYVQERWPALKASQLQRAEIILWTSHWGRARAALGAARHDSQQCASLLKTAASDAKLLERCASLLAQGCGAMIKAAVLDGQGQRKESLDSLEKACLLLERCEANAFLWCARYRLAERRGDTEGMTRARGWLRNQAVVDVERFTHMICPF